jgi:hypothetical protein
MTRSTADTARWTETSMGCSFLDDHSDVPDELLAPSPPVEVSK